MNEIKPNPARLSLRRETLRRLGDEELALAAGGTSGAVSVSVAVSAAVLLASDQGDRQVRLTDGVDPVVQHNGGGGQGGGGQGGGGHPA